MVNFKKHIGLNSGFNSTFARRSSGIAPSNTVAPEITGTLEVGQTLTCSDGTWTGTEPITYSYQWYRGVTPIGADQNTYIVVTADAEQTITCTVTATNAYGSDDATSNGVIIDFYIGNSFLLDGVNEYFSIPNAALVNILSGANCQFSISALINISSAGINTIIGNWLSPNHSLALYVNSSGTIQVVQRDSGVTRFSNSNTGAIVGVGWHLVTFSFDYSLAGGSRSKLFLDGIDVTLTDSLGLTFDVPTGVYKIGSYGNSNYFNGYRSMLSVNNVPMSLAEHQQLYNGGKPLNPQTLFGSNCKYFFNPDNSGATAQFTVNDAVNSINATSVNLETADKTTITPY